jgi:hypothetical protein
MDATRLHLDDYGVVMFVTVAIELGKRAQRVPPRAE